jgi:Zn-dependent protease
MGQSFSLGRISGIRIGVNWSVLIIVALLAYGLAAGQFPAEVPRRPEAEYVVAAIVTAVAYMGSLLAHELAHSLVARRNGVQVEGITLWLLGGVSRLQGEIPDPGAEVRVAGVGPLTSLVLGGVFTLVAWLLHASGVGGVVVAALAWLGGINILLAVFNVIPAAPLDGGRLLQAVLGYYQRPAQGDDGGRPGRAGVRVGPLGGRRVSRAGPAGLQLAVVHHSRLVSDQRGHRGEPAGGGAVPVALGGRAGGHDRRPGHRAGVGHGHPVPA